MVIALHMITRQSNIFVHVECFDEFEGNLPLSMIINQIFIHFEWSFARRKSQPEKSIKKRLFFVTITGTEYIWTHLSGPGWKSFIRFTTYLAAHSPTLCCVSKITNRIFTTAKLYFKIFQFFFPAIFSRTTIKSGQICFFFRSGREVFMSIPLCENDFCISQLKWRSITMKTDWNYSNFAI